MFDSDELNNVTAYIIIDSWGTIKIFRYYESLFLENFLELPI